MESSSLSNLAEMMQLPNLVRYVVLGIQKSQNYLLQNQSEHGSEEMQSKTPFSSQISTKKQKSTENSGSNVLSDSFHLYYFHYFYKN